MSVITVNPRFNPGRLMITRNAKNALPRREVDAAINRHLSGDWGDVCQSDWQRNEQALREYEAEPETAVHPVFPGEGAAVCAG